MTSQRSYVRSDVTFGSGDASCAAWLYRPDGVANPPIVVLAHGFAAFRELRLDAYAARFAQAGYAAFVFDYRHWGASEGMPRRILDIGKQQADWAAALAYVRSLDGIDTRRVVAWGSSFGGGHVLKLAARDTGLAAAIIQVPHVSGPASAFSQSPALVARLILGGIRDQVRAWTGRAPYRMAAVGRPGDIAMMTSPGAYELVERMGDMREELLAENDVAARIALRVPLYSPGRYARDVSAPVLVQLAAKDDVTPIEKAQAVARRIPNGEVHTYDIGHFEPYLDPYFDTIVAEQIDFLDHHLGDPR
ncbi:alpha/beta fold hydrolase [Rhodococcus sp. BP-252]|uniref:alpha/beta hydrolase n=1 Tax=unclassified Rhodococcus (in: high G+C Gram-positive bacteria) TaxID=192944 RepID=UPI0014300B88|nr:MULTISPECIES: alpha/beta fold hydrolase [unclassified Rhodococcus (in: high G+C Gram-positive bacteria)]MBY6410114.1 alpha/beta fold hydrolase [Rhodococcus sp. BP-320]MBY6415083.1 alpha/beta fold hydrolase [Rhodococcus sp. BP-321]MBY6421406.1 alpha/beta fold hydrolase [Rhodococcus sp. BP-324]MBY6425609.1 alpha/beta fold hydrolase [Rhodococcus sp. BP-323]MBY6429979.1 alpha/beta fold hydrolase [Rhodococcus sp. BP-322]